MRKKMMACIVLGCMLLTGCGETADGNWDITDKSVKIADTNDNDYVNPDNEEDVYTYVEIDGVIYLPYGVQKGKITKDMLGECIAYEEDDEAERYYSVAGSSDLIAEYYVDGEEEDVWFLRSEATIGKDITVPDFVEVLYYEIWGEGSPEE